MVHPFLLDFDGLCKNKEQIKYRNRTIFRLWDAAYWKSMDELPHMRNCPPFFSLSFSCNIGSLFRSRPVLWSRLARRSESISRARRQPTDGRAPSVKGNRTCINNCPGVYRCIPYACMINTFHRHFFIFKGHHKIDTCLWSSSNLRKCLLYGKAAFLSALVFFR